MVSAADLDQQARDFAGDVAELLNGTVTNGIRLSAVIAPREEMTIMQVAYGLGKRDLRAKAIPLTLGEKPAIAHLLVAYFLQLDPEQVYLTVTKSQYGLYLDENRTEMLADWDYERFPDHDYPAAHVQVNGDAEHFRTLCERSRHHLQKECPERPLKDLHLPVGGRRYRPSLEDVIEFLVVEELVEARPSWRAVLDEHRPQWEERQLRVAVRRYPEVAMNQLRTDGHI